MEQYKDICKLNELIGNKANDCTKFDNQFQLIIEELGEVQDAYHQINSDDADEKINGIKNLRGEVCDLIVVTIGMAHILGMDVTTLQPTQEAKMLETETTKMMENLKSGVSTHEKTGIEYLLGYVIYMANVYNLPLKDDLQAVNVSNFSKFCTTVEEVSNAHVHFEKLGIEVETVCNDPKYMGFISTMDQKDINHKYYSMGKLLKPPHWIAAEIV